MNPIVTTIQETFAGELIEVADGTPDKILILQDTDATVTIHNSLDPARNIFVFISAEKLTVVFGNWSHHFKNNPKGHEQLLRTLDVIINKHACVLSVYNDTFIFCALSYKYQLVFSVDAKTRVETMFDNPKFLMDAAKKAVRTETLYWEESLELL